MPQGRPVRTAVRAAPQDSVHRRAAEPLSVVRRALDGTAALSRLVSRADVDLRAALGLVETRSRGRAAQLPGARAPSGRLRARAGHQPRRAVAPPRAPLRTLNA